MQNTYAKEYYDTYLKQLPTDYKSARWFSSAEAKLDYAETRRSLLAALRTASFSRVLEIGPGDGVWTDLLLPKAKELTLVDQSVEMIERAKERLKSQTNVTYEVIDFLQYQSTAAYDLIFAIRCFEYFEDKEKAVANFSQLLNAGGQVVLVTKNPKHVAMKKVQNRELHKGQIQRDEMVALFTRHGFEVTSVLSATWRFKAKYWPLRVLFSLLHSWHVATNGKFTVPFVTVPLTESYLYVARKR
ncbi:MAG: class I SAM-dependent methyltransferase [Patescibacteria group bacterium]